MITDWKNAARQKLAAATPQDDKAIAEAFAQQAYTAIGNRDREIMRDPYMLGFEIVSKNEENTRLVGVFAFRVSGEILLAPVFYLNGQIKGQDLLYRKGVNRFVPNTDKWVSYLKSRGEDEEGRPVDRKALDARIHLDLRQMAGSRIKSASHGEDCCDACKKGEKCTCRQPSADFDPDTKVITVLPDDATAEEKKQWEERGFIRREVKMASIRGLWKEAMDAWTAEEPGLLFAQVLLEQGMQKQAAELASRLPEFAELLYLAGSLEKSAQVAEGTAAEGAANAELKAVDAHQITVPAAQDFTEEINLEAAKTAGVNDLTLFLEPQPGWSEQEVEDFYKRGFALRDPREMKYLADAYVESDMSKSLSTLREPGLQTAQDVNGNKARVLWAPIFDPGEILCSAGGNPAVGSAYRNDRSLGSDYGLLFLDGPDSGSFLRFNSSTLETNIPVFQDGDTFEADSENMSDSVNAEVKGVEPVAGKTYAIWLPGMRKMLCPTTIRSIKKSDGITKIHCCSPYSSNPIVINENLEVSDPAAMLTQGYSAPLILGTDAVFVPVEAKVEYESGRPQSAEHINWAQVQPPTRFLPITVGRLNEALLKTKTAAVTLVPVGHGRTDVIMNGKRRAEELAESDLAFKLAAVLRVPGDMALELAGRVSRGEKVDFHLISPAQKAKLASAYYERHIAPDVEFQDFDYDQDFNVPIHNPDQNRAMVQLIRHQRVSPQRRYLDAVGNSGPRNKPHTFIPDEMIMNMADPIREMAEIGSKLGLKSLMDHGAVGSMTKVFDAQPFIKQYVDKLESSLDYLARLLFMLYWKPKDFAESFGSDDLPNLENKLTGVFLSYGDLVLELRQSAGETE